MNTHWSEGYVTDVEYVDEFNPEQSPQNIALAAVLRGVEPPDLSGPFSYCELGCGKGLTSLILAAANPQAQFHAFDFNPSYIARAQAQARAAELANITFHERGLEDMIGPDAAALPMFDIVALHGVWSWVSPALQNAIVDFLKRKVKPGGLVYITYNLMTQWASLVPLQSLLKELVASAPGARDLALRNAFATSERLTQARVIPASTLHAVEQLKRGVPEKYLWAYLSHEFLPDHWTPTSHAEVARALDSAKLKFAASADLLRNLSNVFLNDGQLAALAELPTADLRESAGDWAAGHWLRFDVFVRGQRRMTQSRQDALLGALKLTLVRPVPDVIEIPGANGTVVRALADKYRTLTTALERRPHTVAELLALPVPVGYNPVGAGGLICVLLGAGLALPCYEATPEARAACARLNRLMELEGENPVGHHATIATASLRAGLRLAASDFDLYLSLRRQEQPHAAAHAARLATPLKKNGAQTVGAQAPQGLTSEQSKKIERLTPIWINAGLIEGT